MIQSHLFNIFTLKTWFTHFCRKNVAIRIYALVCMGQIAQDSWIEILSFSLCRNFGLGGPIWLFNRTFGICRPRPTILEHNKNWFKHFNTKNISAEAPEVHTTRNFTCTDWVADRAYWVWDHEVPSECTSEKGCCDTWKMTHMTQLPQLLSAT